MTQTEPVEGRARVDALAVVRFIVGAVFGWMIWWASPVWTGEIEPWDSLGSYYSISLFAAGLISTLFWPNGWQWGPIGIYAGQVAYILLAYNPGGPAIFPAPIAVGLFGTVQAIVGGLMGMGIGLAVTTLRDSHCGK
jgi:hypothetical protein